MMSLDADITIGCAFRYALGRRTYVVDSVAKEIERLAPEISEKTRHRMIAEIDEAINTGNSGMQMDTNRWIMCKVALEHSLKAAA